MYTHIYYSYICEYVYKYIYIWIIYKQNNDRNETWTDEIINEQTPFVLAFVCFDCEKNTSPLFSSFLTF